MATGRRRTSLGLYRDPAITITRMGTQKTELVYVLVANRKHKYPNGRSRIVYVGMTESGVHRIASSVANRAEQVLREKGISSFSAHVVHYMPPRTFSAKLWKKRPVLLLERALIISFQETYGCPPLCNGTGQNMRPTFGEFDRFSRNRIETLIEDLS